MAGSQKAHLDLRGRVGILPDYKTGWGQNSWVPPNFMWLPKLFQETIGVGREG